MWACTSQLCGPAPSAQDASLHDCPGCFTSQPMSLVSQPILGAHGYNVAIAGTWHTSAASLRIRSLSSAFPAARCRTGDFRNLSIRSLASLHDSAHFASRADPSWDSVHYELTPPGSNPPGLCPVVLAPCSYFGVTARGALVVARVSAPCVAVPVLLVSALSSLCVSGKARLPSCSHWARVVGVLGRRGVGSPFWHQGTISRPPLH